MGPTDPDAAKTLITLAKAQGFALSGVCDASTSERIAELDAWLDEGKHGTMKYLERNREIRTDPSALFEGCRSFLMVGDLYRSRGEAEPEAEPESGPEQGVGRGRVARYATGRDYHRVVKKRLHAVCDAAIERFPGATFRAFVDTAPLPERELASRAGLGWVGKHTLLIHPTHGSYFFLGGIGTDLDLLDSGMQPEQDHCGSCTRCIDACPTDAITPYSVDASRCISYLTIEHRAPIEAGFHGAMGDGGGGGGEGGWIFGCDVCQEVCPHNSVRPSAPQAQAHPEYGRGGAARSGFDLLKVLGWTEDDRRQAFTSSAMKRATLGMMRRNAAIVAGSLEDPDPALVERLREIAADEGEDAMVRQAAAGALERLTS